jgi:hypothetical protein
LPDERFDGHGEGHPHPVEQLAVFRFPAAANLDPQIGQFRILVRLPAKFPLS